MAASDVLLFPSLYEGFGGTVIEAMALGLPVVASDIPTLSEVTSDAAIMTEVGSSSELAGAVIELRDDPTLGARLSAAGRARFSSLYTIDAVADQMADFYRAVVAARSI
jgi:alpha-1,3-rhamnosyl/mannosyltransferase